MTGRLDTVGHRPGGDVRRRRRVHRRRAAVLPGLPRGGPGRARAGGRDRRRRRRGVPARGVRAARRRDGRAPRRDARRPVRPGGVLRRRGRRGRAARAASRPGGRRADRAGVQRTARERLLAGAHARSLDRYPLDDVPPGSAARSPTSCSSRARSTRRDVLALARDGLLHAAAHITGRRVPSRTSRGRCRRVSAPTIRPGRPGPSPPIFALVRRPSGASRRRHVRHVQHGRRHGAGRRSRRTSTEILRRSEDRAFAIGEVVPGAGVDRRLRPPQR